MNYDREEFENKLKKREGLRLRPYVDTTGHLTIGWGHNLTSKGINESTAQFILDEDIAEAEMELESAFPWVNNLDPIRQAALLDMSFNLGINRLKKFHPTLELIRKGRFKEAGARLRRTLWYRQVGRRAREVIRMIEDGE